jgi:hypothetical protein
LGAGQALVSILNKASAISSSLWKFCQKLAEQGERQHVQEREGCDINISGKESG